MNGKSVVKGAAWIVFLFVIFFLLLASSIGGDEMLGFFMQAVFLAFFTYFYVRYARRIHRIIRGKQIRIFTDATSNSFTRAFVLVVSPFYYPLILILFILAYWLVATTGHGGYRDDVNLTQTIRIVAIPVAALSIYLFIVSVAGLKIVRSQGSNMSILLLWPLLGAITWVLVAGLWAVVGIGLCATDLPCQEWGVFGVLVGASVLLTWYTPVVAGIAFVHGIYVYLVTRKLEAKQI